ncbi:ornithine decarboxylase SPE1 NDAI_0D04570 [Naumovozyma dairenensis CBS 421]|uniref:Ornithine decarboxylase n=1 Tax=Naumovozyma dairenensis (strain ATCC 10597 / BCRC 20456 / CBS 421 / NBRC 0211 / NRRL Y-12639) TaxID=1071378 RepID=G0WAF9_NAUDC|nr:hypothetical protein NDAI_0D04570 [Naumovozyma dairenensis CBS 421]CCD24770.1 hypothetical protein NDAI_0D04570 [Naumovozyma dairenensis CBS 421]
MSTVKVELNSTLSNSTTTLVEMTNSSTQIKPDSKEDIFLNQYLESLKKDPKIAILPHRQSHAQISEALQSRIKTINDETCEPGDENSFFVCDLKEIRNLYDNWHNKLPRIQPFYAVKCNPNPLILRQLASMGVNFDCASKLEIETILKMGVSPERIIYANPCKVSSFIRFAKEQNVKKSTFDNVEELYKIKKFHPNSDLFLRITTDDSTAQCRLSTKYGCELQNVDELLSKVKELNLNLVGVSFHVGSGASDFSTLYKAVRDARFVFDKAIKDHSLPALKILDVGGGFQFETFNESSAVLNMAIDEFFPENCGVDIIAEPGRYFVATAFTLAAHVIAKRSVSQFDSNDDEHRIMLYINDGVYGNMNCILFDHQEPTPKILYHDGNFHYDDLQTSTPLANNNGVCPYKVSMWGPTCDGLDCITKEYYLKYDLVVGDWLYFPNLGAYTSSAATPFNGFDQTADIIYINQNESL